MTLSAITAAPWRSTRNSRMALLNRGILGYKSGRLPEAIVDFRNALAIAIDPSMRGRIYFISPSPTRLAGSGLRCSASSRPSPAATTTCASPQGPTPPRSLIVPRPFPISTDQ